jgi:hypothetical protein
MRRKDLILTTAAAAVLAVFNPAFAGDSSYDASQSAGVETNDQLVTKADSAKATDDGAPSDELERDGETRIGEEEKLTGLERADQVAGEHGQYGRDNAREKQGLK